MCDIGSSESPSLYEMSTPKARKIHKCCECGSNILPGEKYERIRGLWETFQTYKTCEFCSTVRSKAMSDFDLRSDEGFPFEQLWECVGMDYAADIKDEK